MPTKDLAHTEPKKSQAEVLPNQISTTNGGLPKNYNVLILIPFPDKEFRIESALVFSKG